MKDKRPTPRIPKENIISLKRLEVAMDPLGSYTGIPADPYEVPVQDADDL